jgi:hypothetical protein
MNMIRLQKNLTRLKKLSDEDNNFVDSSPAERLGMMWELTAEIWSLRWKDIAQQRLQRHVASLVRRNKRATGRDKDRLDADQSEK